MLGVKRLWGDRKQVQAPPDLAESPSSIPRRLPSTPRPEPGPPPAPASTPVETRIAPRFVPRRTTTVLVTEGGKKLGARIINVSATGVAVEADFSHVAPESIVSAGERRVVLGRKITRGTVFLFEKPLAPSLCGPDFIL